MSSVDSSFSSWAAGAGAAAEAYADAQADAAANERAAAQAQIDSGAAPAPSDGVEPPMSSSAQSAQDAFWGHDPNRPLASTGAPPPGGSGTGGPTFLTPQEAQQLQQAGFVVSTDEEGRYFVPTQVGNDVIGPSSPWPLLPGSETPSTTPSNDTTAPSGPSQETLPTSSDNLPGGVSGANDAGAPGEPDRIVTGLGAEVDATINQSPTLRRLWDEARAKDWQIQIVRNDVRSNANHREKVITLNLNNIGPGGDQVAKLTSALAHEIGHASHPPHEYIGARTKAEFVAKNTAESLKAEGEAAFENAMARDEILANGGRDIGIRGKFDDDYTKIYEDYKAGHVSKDEAILRMGDVQGREPEKFGPDGSTVTSTRKEQFEQDHAVVWDAEVADRARRAEEKQRAENEASP
jgi:hypothetical protein